MAWIALISPEVEENLGLRDIAAALEAAGFGTELVPFNSGEALAWIVQALTRVSPPPLAVMISLAFQWRARECMALVVALRQAGYRGHITVGGHFGTFAAEELLTAFPE